MEKVNDLLKFAMQACLIYSCFLSNASKTLFDTMASSKPIFKNSFKNCTIYKYLHFVNILPTRLFVYLSSLERVELQSPENVLCFINIQFNFLKLKKEPTFVLQF